MGTVGAFTVVCHFFFFESYRTVFDLVEKLLFFRLNGVGHL